MLKQLHKEHTINHTWLEFFLLLSSTIHQQHLLTFAESFFASNIIFLVSELIVVIRVVGTPVSPRNFAPLDQLWI
jgi:hypothetical protein